MNMSKMVVVGIGMLVFLLTPLQFVAQAQKIRIEDKHHRGVYEEDFRYDRHGHLRYNKNRDIYRSHRHYTPSRHWKYYRHAGGVYAFDGGRWYFRHGERWYRHVYPSWYGRCGGSLIVDLLFPWTYSFAFPGYYDCP